jgi:hypothetical protein
MTLAVADARNLIETTVADRARHETRDKVGDTRSFANMEQTLAREYYGRFLIEMLQNARDAWLHGTSSRPDGLLRIRMTADPTLIVCNEGDPLSPDVVLHSISKFGESPKKPGEGIGHKGIGFKAVLELTHAPRLYSRSDPNGSFDLQVKFDPDEARRLVRAASPAWDQLVASLPSAAADEGRGDRIPILRFPLWDEAPLSWLGEVSRADGRGFNTIVALPYDDRFDSTLELSSDEFIARVRRAFEDVSDEVVLLLAVFGTVLVEDEIDGSIVEITRSEQVRRDENGVVIRDVSICRNGALSSRWWLFESALAGVEGLEGSLSVAVRMEMDGETGTLVPRTPRDDGRPGSTADTFHLFFPTSIKTHLPFLLHAYFEVDAGRKSFADAKKRDNEVRLSGLGSLAVDAVRHLVESAERGEIELSGLPAVFAATDGDPDDPLAAEFRMALLAELDLVPWVRSTGGDRDFSSPHDLLVDDRGRLPELLPVALPADYIWRRARRVYPLVADSDAMAFLAKRNAIARSQGGDGLSGEVLAELLHPEGDLIWAADPDAGFKALIDVLDTVRRDGDVAPVLNAIRSDPSATFIPVVDDRGLRRLRSPGPAQPETEDAEEAPSGAILARVTSTGETPLASPPSLDLDFVADGVFSSEHLAGVGAVLGIRPYLTDVILDAVAAHRDENADPLELLKFTWRLLLRERGKYSVITTLRATSTFDPGRWFWSTPNGNKADSDRVDVRRARGLARLRLPTLAGTWRPATDLAFGEEWAEWLELGEDRLGPASRQRAEAYRDLQAIAPGDDALVAAPSVLAGLLPLLDEDVRWAESDAGLQLPEDPDERHVFLLHALLLRLGVWEIPPTQGFVNYRYPRPEAAPRWADEPEWGALRAAHAKVHSDFAAFAHKNVYVAEDFAFSWPLVANDTFVRALGRGSQFYRSYRWSELFCPQCSSGGRSHSKRYSTNYESKFPSYLSWRLSHDPWVPTSVWGEPPTATSPRDAWYEEERPEEARMQQSWMRYLPVATPALGADLASLAGVRRVAEADAPRIGRLLRALKARFEDGEVDPDRRAGSFASQAFVGLHWRLYERLSVLDPERSRQLLDDVRVLAVLGRTLVYCLPADTRADDGSFVGLRRYFASQVPFIVLTREQGPVADRLGIERFRVDVERVAGGSESTITNDVRPFVHERAAEFLALQIYHPLGARALQLDGREFPLRAERLRRLEVVRVDDLVLRLSVPGTELVKSVGADRGEDMYLDMTASPPRLYLDLAGSRWLDRFRAMAGPHLATLLENPAYGATFQLLLQAETESDIEAFLEERSISLDDVELVSAQMESVAGAVRAEERRWWSVVLPLLGAAVPSTNDGEAFRRTVLERLRAATSQSGVPDLAERLYRAGAGEAVRRDASSEGALAALEVHGIDLRVLHELLVEAGDRGLRIQLASQLLADWRRSHGREVAAVLASRGIDPEDARRIPDGWEPPPDLAFRTQIRPDEYLQPVIADLWSVGIEADAAQLVGPGASGYLAHLVGESEERLASLWHGLFDEAERARLLRDRALGWKRVLRPIIVCARTRAGDSAHHIRSELERVDAGLPMSPAVVAELVPSMSVLLAESPELGDFLAGRLADDRALADPSLVELRPDLGALLDLEHLDRVQAVLIRGRRQAVDQVRQDIEDLRERSLTPTAFAGAQPPPGKGGGDRPAKRTVVRPRRSHDQRSRDRHGARGERVALAAVLDALLARPRKEQDEIIEALVQLLDSVFTSEIVDRLIADARAAQASDDEDDRLESLARFLHVAQASDDFGFDVLGFLAPFVGADPCPLLLEVKNAADRSFIASVPEWRRAEEQGDRYAFFVVLREPGTDLAAALELIPNPAELFRTGQIQRDEESWQIAYRPLPAGSGA